GSGRSQRGDVTSARCPLARPSSHSGGEDGSGNGESSGRRARGAAGGRGGRRTGGPLPLTVVRDNAARRRSNA
ncbi:unnamed protein product, partial [Staurois parvus]